MDEHPIRTSTSMKQRLFMDEEPIDDCLATGRCHREASRRGCRAEIQPKHRQETGLRLVGRCFGTCPCPRSGSVEGPRAKGSIDVPFATRGCLWSTCGLGSRAKELPKINLRTAGDRLWDGSWCGSRCRLPDRPSSKIPSKAICHREACRRGEPAR